MKSMKYKTKKQLAKIMTPRDTFAAHALTGLLAAHTLGHLGAGEDLDSDKNWEIIEGYRRASYALGDAMVEEKFLADEVEAIHDDGMKMTVAEVDAYWDKFFATRPAARREGAEV